MFYYLIVTRCFSNLAHNTPSSSFPLQLQHLYPGHGVLYFIHGEVEWKALSDYARCSGEDWYLCNPEIMCGTHFTTRQTRKYFAFSLDHFLESIFMIYLEVFSKS